MSDAEFRAYFNRIESYFALKRGQALLLSPEEFQVVEALYHREVPLPVVLRGIDRFFEKRKKRRRASRRQVFLTHVVDDIEEVAADFARKGVGAHRVSGPTETEFIRERLDAIRSALAAVAEPFEALAAEVIERIDGLHEAAESRTMDEIEGELEQLAALAQGQIFDRLDPEITRRVDAEIADLQRRTGRSIEPEILERFRTERVLDLVGFPAITLYG